MEINIRFLEFFTNRKKTKKTKKTLKQNLN